MPSFTLLRTIRCSSSFEVVAAAIGATVTLALVALLIPSTASARTHSITLPIDPAYLDDVHWTDTWGAPRSGGRTHIGVDMMGPKMVPLVAAADSEVTWGRFNNGRGTIVRLRDDAGWEYQYIHINNDTPGTDDGNASCLQALAPKLCETMESDGDLAKGTRFAAGELIGYLGDSGNAEWTAPHLHFEIYQPDGTGDVVPINPTPYVDAAVDGAGVETESVGPFANSEVAANEIMRRLEGRSASWQERQIVAAAVADGGLAGALAEIIEGNPSAAMIDRLYLAFFQRDPDKDGLEHWIGTRGDGHRLEDIAEWFAESDEFKTRYGGTDFGEFLDRLYAEVLGRPSDAEGRAYWLGLLNSGQVTRGTIVVYFTESAELRRVAQSGNELMVVHKALGWDRPTAAQVDAWSSTRATTSLVDAIDSLIGSS
ncbi:MAG: DUF4214 domain-containing protein [Actinomycetota bacterium]